MLANETAIAKLRDRLDKVSDFNWNILLIDPNKYDDCKKYIARNHPDLSFENHITFIKNSSSGDALTADMLLHTICHAVYDRDRQVYFNEIVNAMKPLLTTGNDERDISQYLHMSAAKNIFKSEDQSLPKAKRDRLKHMSFQPKLFAEIVLEMTASFIRNGKVRFSPNEFCLNPQSELAMKIESHVNSAIRKALNACVGKILTDPER